MITNKHLLLTVPEDWTTDQKGDFYENFVSELLRPMRLKVVNRIRVTGMEIDLLAKGEDEPRMILVECKAHRDPLAADVISKLLGNVKIRKADAGWLFSTSDLSKDGKGQWEEIQADADLARDFTWYSPERTIDVLIGQRAIVDPLSILHHLSTFSIGDWTLILTPTRRVWLAQLIEDGIPTRFSVFDASTGTPLAASDAQAVADLTARFNSLTLFEVPTPLTRQLAPKISRAPVAPVVSGDTWDDLRPARPVDFVGRDDIIEETAKFIDQARLGSTSTRTFAIQGPSGWGKSSLILKLSDLAKKDKILRCSATAVDARSATNSAFVSEAIRMAFIDAAKNGLLPKSEFRVGSLRDPLDSLDLTKALEQLQKSQSCLVLIFDQFEELFSKEELFETFNAVRELSLDIDARQVPLILGFAWKTDVSLPQLHPAYHLWHQLADRRRSFKIREFGKHDIQKIINKAERASGRTLSIALQARLIEQCQGLPWLLKKLLVHVLQRVSAGESQYLLLERELDVELLFKEDLSVLSDEHIRCLKYVATSAPVAVSDVEENFTRETTNLLINSHLLVRSGMNYVVYWDIFRDYLVEERVPHIPWARTFQRGPTLLMKVLNKLVEMGPVTASTLAPTIGLRERPCFNLISDLVALQLVDSTASGLYKPASHLADLTLPTIAKYVQGQLKRHVVVRALMDRWERDKFYSLEDWNILFAEAHPRTSTFSEDTIHRYANSFRAWLLFAGILEIRNKGLIRPPTDGRQMGILKQNQVPLGIFLGTAAPKSLVRLLKRLREAEQPISRSQLEAEGLRNATSDGLALGLISASRDGSIQMVKPLDSLNEVIQHAKNAVSVQNTLKVIAQAQRSSNSAVTIGRLLEAEVGAKWKRTSATRYASGLRRYLDWVTEDSRQAQLSLLEPG